MRAGHRKHWCRAERGCQTFKGFTFLPGAQVGLQGTTLAALSLGLRHPIPRARPLTRPRAPLSRSRSRSPPLVSTLVVAAPAPQTAPRPLARAALARVVVGERPQRDSRLALGARRQRVRRLEGGDAEEARVRVLLSHRLRKGNEGRRGR